jgi:hypothetical protein
MIRSLIDCALHPNTVWSQDRAVRIVAGYELDLVRVLVGSRIVSTFSAPNLRLDQILIQLVPEVKELGLETAHLLLVSRSRKPGYIHLLPPYVFKSSVELITHRINFTFDRTESSKLRRKRREGHITSIR